MLTIRRILCPVDFSDFSRRGLDLAFAVAARSGAEITALHVTAAASLPPTSAAFPEVPAFFPLDPTVMERLRAELACFVAPSRTPDIQLRTVVEEGAPVTRILTQAKELGADLIVMGTHGVGGFERWVLGSVAEKVLRKAPCPVLTVTKARVEAFPPDPGRFCEVLCALDLSDGSQRTLADAVSMAQAAGAHLTLLHVLEDAPQEEAAVVHAGVDLSAYRAQRCQEARQRLRALAKDVCCAHDEIVKTGTPFREILLFAEERGAGLIVVGVHGGRFLDLLHFGSTAHHVVRGAACPVLTVRERR
jgi:nucleotide-binding universal stress UspA family protein